MFIYEILKFVEHHSFVSLLACTIVVIAPEETRKFHGYYFHCSYFSTNKVLSNMYKDRVPSVQSIEELNALCIDDKPVEKKIRIPAKSEFSSAVTYDPIVQ